MLTRLLVSSRNKDVESVGENSSIQVLSNSRILHNLDGGDCFSNECVRREQVRAGEKGHIHIMYKLLTISVLDNNRAVRLSSRYS